MGELHLEIITDRIAREFKVGITVGKPQVAYKESAEEAVRCEGKFEQQIAGKQQYGHVKLEIEPLLRGSGFTFVNNVDEKTIPKDCLGAVQKGVEDGLDAGPLLGFPVVDIGVSLIGGSYHEDESTPQAFGIAASMALREGLRKIKSVLLEPIMAVEIVVPDDYLGEVMADLNSKRAHIQGIGRGNAGLQVIKALVPLAEMFGYSTDLRSATQGRASYSMQFSQYDKVPERIAEHIINRVRGLI